MFSEPVLFRDAVIDSAHLKTQDGKVQTRVTIHASLTQETSELLGVKSLVYAPNGTPKEGFVSLDLDTGCAACRIVVEHPELKQSFEIPTGDSTDQYVLERLDEGRLKLKLRINYHGDPLPLADFVTKVGNAESRLKIVPLQSEIPLGKADEKRAREMSPRVPSAAKTQVKPEEYLSDKPVVVSAEAVRQRLVTHRGKQAQGAK